ncbi:hypothetical protein ACE01N_17125 [Saccharicrinis sp. FJH2]|uniref:hypothetical protein n=1 Tax=Saccharicrinis sp. FJH65 TaxID=3344659 RepID=UPI0035F3E5F6
MKTFKTIIFIGSLSISLFHLQAQTEVRGHITENTIWSYANSPHHIMDDITNDNGVILNIEASVVIKLGIQERYSYYRYDIFINSILNPRETPINPDVFTSFRDDTYGGDTNSDSNAISPSAGDWSRIKFTSQPNVSNTSQNCIVKYGGISRTSSTYYTSILALIRKN